MLSFAVVVEEAMLTGVEEESPTFEPMSESLLVVVKGLKRGAGECCSEEESADKNEPLIMGEEEKSDSKDCERAVEAARAASAFARVSAIE